MALGCTPFKNAQKKACTCGDEMALEDKSNNKKHTVNNSINRGRSDKSEQDSSKTNKKNKKQNQEHNITPSKVKINEENKSNSNENKIKDEKSKTSRKSGEL